MTCKEEELPAEREVRSMAIKHKIVINISDPNGREANVLRGETSDKASKVPVRGFHTGVSLIAGADGGIGRHPRS